MNDEIPRHKTGLIGELLVKTRLNEYGINTGSVDKDTGTDIVMFRNNRILTAQVKSRINTWNNAQAHGVHVHFKVKLKEVGGVLHLDTSVITWKRIDIQNSVFVPFTRASIAQIFQP